MKARNSLDTAPEPRLDDRPYAAQAEPVAAIEAPAMPAPAAPETPWVDLAAGQAVKVASHPPILPAKRTVEAPSPESLEAEELAREEHAAEAHGDPSRGYRTMHATVFTLVMGFFAAGAGMCVYVLVQR